MSAKSEQGRFSMRVSVLVYCTSLALTGSVLAQASDHASTSLAQGTEFKATLSRSVDARKAKPGDEATATLAQDVRANGHVALHRGVKLVGHVTEAQSHHASSADGRWDSHLGIVFDRAVMSDGREVPIDATIQAVASAEAVATTRAQAFGHDAAASASGSAPSTGLAGAAGSSSLLGNVAGAPGGAVATLGGNVVAGAGSTVLGAASASAGAVGGLSTAGRLTPGSRGVFGIYGVEIVTASAEDAVSRGSVLTSHKRNVALARGTQMLLVTGGQVAGDAAGAADIGPASSSASGGTATSADGSTVASRSSEESTLETH
jgi:hypothetical protein